MTEARKVPKAAKTKSHLQNREVSRSFLLHVWASGHPSDAATVTPGASTCVHCSEPTAVPGQPVNRAASGPKGISSSKIKGGMISRQQDHEGAPDPG